MRKYPAEPVTVTLAAGVWRLDEPLVFTAVPKLDDASNSYRIELKNTPDLPDPKTGALGIRIRKSWSTFLGHVASVEGTQRQLFLA